MYSDVLLLFDRIVVLWNNCPAGRRISSKRRKRTSLILIFDLNIGFQTVIRLEFIWRISEAAVSGTFTHFHFNFKCNFSLFI